MPLVVVTGLSGVGKSTVYERLRQLGQEALGSDEDGFLVWSDRATGLPVTQAVDFRDAASTKDIYCSGVSRERVEALRESARDRTVYLCGCAGREGAFLDLIDHLICLVADDATLLHRLNSRTDHTYGKSREEQAAILQANVTWEADYRRIGTTIVDATQPIDTVVMAVIAAAEGHGADGSEASH